MGTKEALEKAKDVGDLTVLQGLIVREMRWRAGRKEVGLTVWKLGKVFLEMGMLVRSDVAIYQVLGRMERDELVEKRKERTEEGKSVTRYYVTEKGDQLAVRLEFLDDRWRGGVALEQAHQNQAEWEKRSKAGHSAMDVVMSRSLPAQGQQSPRPTSVPVEDGEEEEISEVQKIVEMIEGGGQPDYEEQVIFNRFNALATGFVNRKVPRDEARKNAFRQMKQEGK